MALILSPLQLSAGQPSAGMELEKRDVSPRGDFRVEHYFNSKNYEREVWLAPVNQASERVLLYSHSRSVDILFSPDQQWVIINDFFGSSSAEPYLFKRATGLGYSKVKNAKISEKVWQLVGKHYPLVLTREFGHQYVQVLRWANDSRSFLTAAFGHLDSPDTQRALDPWLCVFTIDGLRTSLDLGLINRGALHSRPEGEKAPSGPWK